MLTFPPDREEALKDDYPLDDGAYDDEDDDDWAGDDAAWTEEVDEIDENDVKDESTAYLEFLNEEVSSRVLLSYLFTRSWLTFNRHKSSRTSMTMIRTMS